MACCSGWGGGVAYIVAQQGVNMMVRRHKGRVNGYIVGLYPLGAMIAPQLSGGAAREHRWKNPVFPAQAARDESLAPERVPLGDIAAAHPLRGTPRRLKQGNQGPVT